MLEELFEHRGSLGSRIDPHCDDADLALGAANLVADRVEKILGRGHIED